MMSDEPIDRTRAELAVQRETALSAGELLRRIASAVACERENNAKLAAAIRARTAPCEGSNGETERKKVGE